MKIAIIATNRKPIPSPPKLIFAPGIIIKQLAEGLVKKGHDVTLFAPEGTKTSAKLITAGTRSLYEDFASEDDFTTKRANNLESYLLQDVQYQLLLDSIAFDYIKKNDFDVIHSHNPRHDVYFTPFVDAPCVFTFHDSEREILSEIDRRRLQHFDKSCYFISISDAQRSVFGKLNWFATVYNGTDLKNFNFSRGGSSIVFAGRLDRKKGVDITIEVAKKINRPLLIAGDIAKNPDGEKLFSEIKPSIDGKLIKYLGHIKFDQMNSIYAQGKVSLTPIRWIESFGLVMIEAMACGTPVIGFNHGSVSEILVDGVTGFICPPDDINGMIEATKKIFEMPEEKYQSMRKACRKHVEENFSVEKMVDKYEEVYEKAIKDRKGKNAD